MATPSKKKRSRRARKSRSAKKSTGVSVASRDVVRDYFVGAQRAAMFSDWIAPTNVYRKDCIKQYRIDLDAAAVNQSHMCEYVAVSAPTHVIDGWSFLARAIDALFRGDRYAAIHLGYYCELRAAMALLASQGVGVLNGQHAIVGVGPPSPKITKPNSELGTHLYAWAALNEWSSSAGAGALLDECIAPGGIRLSRWLDVAGKPSASIVASHWFPNWGIDLRGFTADRNRRNLVSYNPSEILRPPSIDVLRVIDFVLDLWRLFEPSSARRFQNLEFELLRSILKVDAKAAARIIDKIGLPESYSSEIASSTAKDKTSITLDLAMSHTDVDSGSCDLEVIARAALLLSFATSSARSLLSEAAYSVSDLTTWLERYSSGRGIDYVVSSIGPPSELWADVSEKIEEARSWRTAQGGGPVHLGTWRKHPAAAAFELSAFELAGMWGLVP